MSYYNVEYDVENVLYYSIKNQMRTTEYLNAQFTTKNLILERKPSPSCSSKDFFRY